MRGYKEAARKASKEETAPMVANWERRNTPNYSNRSRYADTVLPGTVLDVGFQTILYARCGPYAIRGLCAGLLLLD